MNYFNFRKLKDRFLITNDLGSHAFLTSGMFRALLKDGCTGSEEMDERLRDGAFIYDGDTSVFIENHMHRMRDAKQFLFQPAQLHIFVVTTACNMMCVYCQAGSDSVKSRGFMSKETAEKAVDMALRSPSQRLQFEFQGGEPLLNFDVIRHIVEYSKEKAGDRDIAYSLVTNLTLLNDEMLEFIKEYGISVSTSLDGSRPVHDGNRPYKNGNGTFDDVRRSVELLRKNAIPTGALLTTTRQCLGRPREIIDTYIDMGFTSISLRPLTPLGAAKEAWGTIGYTPEEFTGFYKEAFDYLMEVNRTRFMMEGIASILLSKILNGWGTNYMELRSPCGASMGQMAYHYDGNIYTCDEGRMAAEMGDRSFRLGNVYEDTYDSLMDCSLCRGMCASSITESLPSCSDCAYQPYCGVCPIINYVLDGDVYERTPNNLRCRINKGILDTIFSRLMEDDEDINEILARWTR